MHDKIARQVRWYFRIFFFLDIYFHLCNVRLQKILHKDGRTIHDEHQREMLRFNITRISRLVQRHQGRPSTVGLFFLGTCSRSASHPGPQGVLERAFFGNISDMLRAHTGWSREDRQRQRCRWCTSART